MSIETHTFKLQFPDGSIEDDLGADVITSSDPATPVLVAVALESSALGSVQTHALRRGWGYVGAGDLTPALTTYTQTYSTTGTVIPAYTPDAETSAYSGINGALGSNCAAVSDLNALRVAYENLRASHEALLNGVNRIIDDGQARGTCA